MPVLNQISFVVVLGFFAISPVLAQNTAPAANPEVQEAKDAAAIAQAYREMANAYNGMAVEPLVGTVKTTKEANMSGIILAYGQVNYGAKLIVGRINKVTKAALRKQTKVILLVGEDPSAAYVRQYQTALVLLSKLQSDLQKWANRVRPTSPIQLEELEQRTTSPQVNNKSTEMMSFASDASIAGSTTLGSLFSPMPAIGIAGDIINSVAGIMSMFRVNREYFGSEITGDESALANAVAGQLATLGYNVYWPSHYNPSVSKLMVDVTHLSDLALTINARIDAINTVKIEALKIASKEKRSADESKKLKLLNAQLVEYGRSVSEKPGPVVKITGMVLLINQLTAPASPLAGKNAWKKQVESLRVQLVEFNKLPELLVKYDEDIKLLGKYASEKELKDDQLKHLKELHAKLTAEKRTDDYLAAVEEFLLKAGTVVARFKDMTTKMNTAGSPFEMEKLLMAESLVSQAGDDGKILSLGIVSAGGEQMTIQTLFYNRRESLGGMVMTYNMMNAADGRILSADVFPLSSGFVEDDEIQDFLYYRGAGRNRDRATRPRIQGSQPWAARKY